MNSPKENLLELATLKFSILNDQNLNLDEQHYERIEMLQLMVLNSFGLTRTIKNEELINFNKIPTDFELDEVLEKLHARATSYLTSDVKSDIQILTEAQTFKLDLYEVLEELNITINMYSSFVFYKILFNKRDSIENVLNALRLFDSEKVRNMFVVKNDDISVLSDEFAAELKKLGVKYYDQFLKYNNSSNSSDDFYM